MLGAAVPPYPGRLEHDSRYPVAVRPSLVPISDGTAPIVIPASGLAPNGSATAALAWSARRPAPPVGGFRGVALFNSLDASAAVAYRSANAPRGDERRLPPLAKAEGDQRTANPGMAFGSVTIIPHPRRRARAPGASLRRGGSSAGGAPTNAAALNSGSRRHGTGWRTAARNAGQPAPRGLRPLDAPSLARRRYAKPVTRPSGSSCPGRRRLVSCRDAAGCARAAEHRPARRAPGRPPVPTRPG
jgi:hypothetical protein